MIDTKNFQPLNVEENGNKKRGVGKGVLTIICSKNGKRLLISKELEEILELTHTVKLGFIGKNLVLGKHLPGDSNVFSLKRQGKKQVIYSAEAIRVIAQMQNISFEKKVSHTWYFPKVDEYENSPVAIFEPEGGDNCEA